MLVKFVSDKRHQWSSYLDTCVFAYNTSRHSSSKFTPFELMFSRRATLPIDLEMCANSPGERIHHYDEAPTITQDDRLIHRQKQLEEAKENIIAAQAKQKELYDRKHANPERSDWITCA